MKRTIKNIGLLLLLSCMHALLYSQNNSAIVYGNNPNAGHYFNVGDALLYYEVYGKGEPIVMLHGGVYGYIDEFAPFIARLSEKYKVRYGNRCNLFYNNDLN